MVKSEKSGLSVYIRKMIFSLGITQLRHVTPTKNFFCPENANEKLEELY